MRKLLHLLSIPVVALSLISAVGCEEAATPPSPEQDAQRAASEKEAMEKFRAANKGGKGKTAKADVSAKAAETPAEAPAEAPK